MSEIPRFQSAVSSTRPVGMRVLEAYSPKLGRRLQCFGESAFEQWIRLEADPLVQVFCERPVNLNLANGELLADFWVRRRDRETLLTGAHRDHAAEVGLFLEFLTLKTPTTGSLMATSNNRIFPQLGRSLGSLHDSHSIYC